MAKISAKLLDSDRGFNSIMQEFADANVDHVVVGVTGDKDSSMIDIATWNEFGTENIPERPFIRQTFDRTKEDLSKLSKGLYGLILDGKITKRAGLERLGDDFKNKVRKAIGNREFVVNAPITIARKGSDLPLVDSARLLQSIDYEVR